jgi:hypothetical protein
LIATAVEAELASYLAQFADLRTEAGHAAVVRNELTANLGDGRIFRWRIMDVILASNIS